VALVCVRIGIAHSSAAVVVMMPPAQGRISGPSAHATTTSRMVSPTLMTWPQASPAVGSRRALASLACACFRFQPPGRRDEEVDWRHGLGRGSGGARRIAGRCKRARVRPRRARTRWPSGSIGPRHRRGGGRALFSRGGPLSGRLPKYAASWEGVITLAANRGGDGADLPASGDLERWAAARA
jgi:hypothetical protein